MHSSDDEVQFVTTDGNKYIGQPWKNSRALVSNGYADGDNNTSTTTAAAVSSDPYEDRVVGSVYYANGNRFQGENVSGTPCGYGVLTATGSLGQTIVYDGEWSPLGLRSGTGRLRRFRQGISTPLVYLYEGDFKDDKPNGSGTETIWTDPVALNAQSQKQNNSAHQQHQQHQPNHNNIDVVQGGGGVVVGSGGAPRLEYRFTGHFLDGLRHGHGLLEDEVKSRIVEGEFREGLPHGKVIVKWLRADNPERLRAFDGFYERGEMHGAGTLVSTNGETFRGEFRRGNRLNGVITDADGSHARRAVYDEHGALVEFTDLENGSVGRSAERPDNKNDSSAAAALSNSNSNSQDINRSASGIHATYATVDYPNGDQFFGDVIAGRPHGQGRTTFAGDSGFYEGEYKDGKFHGSNGLLVQNSRSPEHAAKMNAGERSPRLLCWRYEGGFANGEFHGHGKWWGRLPSDDDESAASIAVASSAASSNGRRHRRDVFVGSFVNGQMTGIGNLTYGDCSVFLPDNSNKDKKTVVRIVRYEGEFLHSSPHGRGALWMTDRVIRGIFVEGSCCDEHASIEYFDGENESSGNGEVVESYEGGVVNNQRSGMGEHKYRNGDVYFGEFAGDLRHGVGILKLAAGGSMEGRFRHDVPDGPASVRRADNSRFVGSVGGGEATSVGGVVTNASGVEMEVVAA